METKDFFCSRVERGATKCGEQCAQCAERKTVEEHTIGEKGVRHAPIEPEQASPAAPQGPQLVASLSINLFDNGHMQVNGPFHDRILFGGLLRMADIIEREQAHNAELRARREAEARANEPFWKRKLRERKERKECDAMNTAARIAAQEAVSRKDELTAALAKNAKP